MGCRPQGFAKAPECPEVPAFKASGMACHVHDRMGQHMVTLSLELGTLSAAGWLSQPHSSPDLPHLPGRAKLPAASEAYCSAVTRNGCRAQTGERLEATWGRGGRLRKLLACHPLACVPGRSLRQIQPSPQLVPSLLLGPTRFLSDVFSGCVMWRVCGPISVP